VKLRNFIPTDRELPPTNLYVLGYWEGEPAPFVVIRRDEHGMWLSSNECMEDDYTPPTSWHSLPGGHDFNTAGLPIAVGPDKDLNV
jgi:hypothetical protein